MTRTLPSTFDTLDQDLAQDGLFLHSMLGGRLAENANFLHANYRNVIYADAWDITGNGLILDSYNRGVLAPPWRSWQLIDCPWIVSPGTRQLQLVVRANIESPQEAYVRLQVDGAPLGSPVTWTGTGTRTRYTQTWTMPEAEATARIRQMEVWWTPAVHTDITYVSLSYIYSIYLREVELTSV